MAEAQVPRCNCCHTRDVAILLECHNSACRHYATPQRIYEGWRSAQEAPAAVAVLSISQVTKQMRAAGDHAWMTSDCVDSARVFWAMLAAAPTTQPAPQQEAAEDVDGHAFRTAARLGLTLRFYGGCAQSGMPGSPSAYEVCADRDRAAAMREAVARAEAVISRGGEAQRLEAPQQERVYLVATGEVLNGRELYERHEKYVPLADCETLYTAPQPLPASQQGDVLDTARSSELLEAEAKAYNQWFSFESTAAYEGDMWAFGRAAWMARAVARAAQEGK